MYKILLYTKRKAKQLNVIVLPSEKANKKINDPHFTNLEEFDDNRF